MATCSPSTLLNANPFVGLSEGQKLAAECELVRQWAGSSETVSQILARAWDFKNLSEGTALAVEAGLLAEIAGESNPYVLLQNNGFVSLDSGLVWNAKLARLQELAGHSGDIDSLFLNNHFESIDQGLARSAKLRLLCDLAYGTGNGSATQALTANAFWVMGEGLTKACINELLCIVVGIEPSLSWLSTTGVTGSPASSWLSEDGSITLSQGSAANRPSISASAFGSNQGLSFDGSNDILSYSGKAVSDTAAGSISLIFKTPSTVTGPVVIVSQSDSASANDWWEIGISSTGRMYVESNVSGTKLTVSGSTVLDANTIYNCILCFDGVDFYMQLNGAEENPLTIESIGPFAWLGSVSGTVVFSVGGTVTSGGTERPFNGTVGAVTIWNVDITE